MKIGRQAKIIELISRNKIETQEELCARLISEGYNITQATVSRDIRNLKLTKLVGPGGKQYYAVMPGSTDYTQKYRNILRDGFISCEPAMNLLVIKTIPGMAMPVAAAMDAMNFEEIVGCIAGDDTVMIATRSAEDATVLSDKVNDIAHSSK